MSRLTSNALKALATVNVSSCRPQKSPTPLEPACFTIRRRTSKSMRRLNQGGVGRPLRAIAWLVHTLLIGEKEGQVSIRKLQMRVTKLPRKLKRTEVPKLERKLKPLDKALPIPGGIDPNLANRPRPKPR
jgi:hypothetical protein